MGKFHCDVCSSDCTRRIRITCAECQDYDLCVPCFAAGKSSGKHKPWHDYKVIEQHQYPIFDEDWGADEELLLIEGCQTLGLGNWQDVADYIEGRSKDEVGKHYEQIYLNSSYYPIPDLNKTFPQVSTTEFLKKRKQRFDSRKKMPLPPPKKVLTSQPLCSYIQKYMPGRLEFEEEAEEEAEKVVQDMVFDADEADEDVELKLLILQIYNDKLTLRAERKRLMINDNLLDYKTNNALDKKRTKEERELYNKIKAFARVMSATDFTEFSDGIMNEFQLRNKIMQLQNWRRNGITQLEDGEFYEKEKLSRVTKIPTATPSIASSKERHTLNSGRSHSRMSTPVDGANGNKLKKKTINIEPLDIIDSPDYNLLSEGERLLCQELRIYPKPYLCIKEILFKELLNNGGILDQKRVNYIVRLDPLKTSRIYDYFVQQKWCQVS
ncbi:Transcriptional adapter ada2 [Pichia californica]|uniref:Transcriptional adapter 2 n=1 Tax=Pichia californica TaxID=460514 RepID=A0A9P7BGB5_9ASCO|nr:Transcriptional adapter ada2 [[Candida] californica]KAG0688098.1 Transcriptional adapter ada2 [[Candida] californica]